MEVTPFGLTVALIGIMFFFLRKSYLFWAFVISVSFWESQMAYFPPITFSLRPHFYFMILLILREIMDSIITNRWVYYKTKESLYLALFITVASFSLIMPIWIDGKAVAHPLDSPFTPVVYEPIALGRVHFTQLLYLVFWGLGFWALVNQMKSIARIKAVAKAVVWLGVVTVVIGFVNLFGLTEVITPLYALIGGHAPSTKLVEGISRMFSISGEPGWTSLYLLFPLGLMAGPLISGQSIYGWSRKTRTLILIILLAGLIMSGTTGYVGLLFFVGAIMILGYRYHIFFRSLSFTIKLGIALTVVFLGLMVSLYLVFESPLVDYVLTAHYEKVVGQSRSVPVRWQYTVDGFRLFSHYPVLGAGIGSNKASALIISLLSNLGVLGTVMFLAFNVTLLRKCLPVPAQDQESVEPFILQISLFLSLFSVLGAALIGKSIGLLIKPNYWLLCAMIFALALTVHHYGSGRVLRERKTLR